jgi:hypothetical protein
MIDDDLAGLQSGLQETTSSKIAENWLVGSTHAKVSWDPPMGGFPVSDEQRAGIMSCSRP